MQSNRVAGFSDEDEIGEEEMVEIECGIASPTD
jgi:hypothetical protein